MRLSTVEMRVRAGVRKGKDKGSKEKRKTGPQIDILSGAVVKRRGESKDWCAERKKDKGSTKEFVNIWNTICSFTYSFATNKP